jgi:hypothetical protein
MATGRLGVADLIAAENTTLYTVPSDTFAVISVNLCNRSNQAVNVRIAIAVGLEPSLAEFIEFDTELLGKGVLERTGIIMNATQRLIVYSNAAGVSAVAFGIETPQN